MNKNKKNKDRSMKTLSHTNEDGKARMVDVGAKEIVNRVACASGFISLNQETLTLVEENTIKKGDVLAVAEIAGIQAAKNTFSMIPLCHNITLDKVSVIARPVANGISVVSEVSCTGKTGVEMEALIAVSIALLTIYDMCKSVDKNMEISNIKLTKKRKSTIKD
jgi:cyclic pyranopterin phosphate synthase